MSKARRNTSTLPPLTPQGCDAPTVVHESVTVIQAKLIETLTDRIKKLERRVKGMGSQVTLLRRAMATPALAVPMQVSELDRPARKGQL